MANGDANGNGSAQSFYEFAIWKLTEQNRSIESIERKIASAIATWSILLVLILGIFTFDSRQGTEGGELSSERDSVSYLSSDSDGSVALGPVNSAAIETAHCVSWSEMGFGIAIAVLVLLFLAAVYCAYQGFRTRQWKTGPSLAVAQLHAAKRDPSSLLLDIGDKLEEAQRENDSQLREKGKWCDRTLRLSLFGVVLSLALALALRLIQ